MPLLDDINQKIATLLRSLLDLPLDAPVEELSRAACGKWDSLVQVALIALLEDSFDVEFVIDDYPGMESFSGISSALKAKLAKSE